MPESLFAKGMHANSFFLKDFYQFTFQNEEHKGDRML